MGLTATLAAGIDAAAVSAFARRAALQQVSARASPRGDSIGLGGDIERAECKTKCSFRLSLFTMCLVFLCCSSYHPDDGHTVPLAAPVVKGSSGARLLHRVGATPAYSPCASPGPSAQVVPVVHQQHQQQQQQSAPQQWAPVASPDREYASGSEALAVLEQTRARYRAQQLEQQQQQQQQQHHRHEY